MFYRLLAFLMLLAPLASAKDTLHVNARWPNGTLQVMKFWTGKALHRFGGHDTLPAWGRTDTMGVYREGYDSLNQRWGWIQVGRTNYDSTMPNPNNFRADSLAVNGRKLIAYTPTGQLETHLDSINFSGWARPVTTTNILTNGSFERGTTNWSHYANGGATNGFSVVSTAPIADSLFKGRITLDATIGSNNQIYHQNIPLIQGRTYRLRFSVYGSIANTLQVRVIKATTPYTVYGFNFQGILISTNWQTYEIDFTATGFVGTTTDCMLQFYFPASMPNTTIYLDGVSING